MDRTLGIEPVPLNKFALLGITSLFMAAKYEEVMVPNIDCIVRLGYGH